MVEQKCETTYETTYENKCETVYDTEYDKECNTVYDTVNEKKCEPKYENVCSTVYRYGSFVGVTSLPVMTRN